MIDKNAPGMDAPRPLRKAIPKTTPKVLQKPTPKLKRKSAANSYRGKSSPKVMFPRKK